MAARRAVAKAQAAVKRLLFCFEMAQQARQGVIVRSSLDNWTGQEGVSQEGEEEGRGAGQERWRRQRQGRRPAIGDRNFKRRRQAVDQLASDVLV